LTPHRFGRFQGTGVSRLGRRKRTVGGMNQVNFAPNQTKYKTNHGQRKFTDKGGRRAAGYATVIEGPQPKGKEVTVKGSDRGLNKKRRKTKGGSWNSSSPS